MNVVLFSLLATAVAGSTYKRSLMKTLDMVGQMVRDVVESALPDANAPHPVAVEAHSPSADEEFVQYVQEYLVAPVHSVVEKLWTRQFPGSQEVHDKFLNQDIALFEAVLRQVGTLLESGTYVYAWEVMSTSVNAKLEEHKSFVEFKREPYPENFDVISQYFVHMNGIQLAFVQAAAAVPLLTAAQAMNRLSRLSIFETLAEQVRSHRDFLQQQLILRWHHDDDLDELFAEDEPVIQTGLEQLSSVLSDFRRDRLMSLPTRAGALFKKAFVIRLRAYKHKDKLRYVDTIGRVEVGDCRDEDCLTALPGLELPESESESGCELRQSPGVVDSEEDEECLLQRVFRLHAVLGTLSQRLAVVNLLIVREVLTDSAQVKQVVKRQLIDVVDTELVQFTLPRTSTNQTTIREAIMRQVRMQNFIELKNVLTEALGGTLRPTNSSFAVKSWRAVWVDAHRNSLRLIHDLADVEISPSCTTSSCTLA